MKRKVPVGDGQDVAGAGGGSPAGDQPAAAIGVPPPPLQLGAGQGPLDAAFAALSEGVLVGDPHGRITRVNAALLRITGRAEADLLGRRIDVLCSPRTHADVRRRLRQALATGQGFAAVLARQCGDGAVAWNEFSLRPVLDAAGALVQFVGVVRDVTDGRLLQDQLLHAQKLEAIDQLSGGVAHAFNNLLTVITGNIELLQDTGRVTADIEARIQEISRAADRAAELTHQLLQFGGRRPRHPRVLDLNAVVAPTVGMLGHVLGDGIRIELDPQLRPAWVLADEAGIEQVLMNLCVNARDAMPDGGHLRITVAAAPAEGLLAPGRTLGPAADARPAGASVVLAVEDTGCGIAAAHRHLLFQPFFTTKGAGRGTGLGLATVARIAREHGGGCAVDSEVGKGTRVLFWLPAADAAAASAAP